MVGISKNILFVLCEYTNVIMNGGNIFGYDTTVNSNRRFDEGKHNMIPPYLEHLVLR